MTTRTNQNNFTRSRGPTADRMADWVRAVVLLGVVGLQWLSSVSGLKEVCSGETFQASCETGEVIVMDTAEYGRMEAGRCGVTLGGGSVGCRNDFLSLLDSKCSGRRECMFVVGGNEFYEANTQCSNKELLAYLRISYSCIKVELRTRSECLIPKKLPLPPQEGFIASHVTDDTGCGTARFPWSIEGQPGQTINLTLLDFGALSRKSSDYVRCQDNIFGYIIEKSGNKTICGSNHRERNLYSSTGNTMEIHVIQKGQRADHSFFLIRYRVIGCSDLSPPGNAYFKRDRHEAVIGCKGTDITWRLLCNGNTWDGVVGNCTAKMAAVASKQEDALPMQSVLVVAAIIGATVVVAVLIVVSGVVYIKRYKHSQDLRANTMQYTLHYTPKGGQPTQMPRGGTYRPMACAHARPEVPSASRAPTLAKPRRLPPSTGTGKPLQHIWEMPLPDPHAKKETPTEGIYMNPSECTCSTATNGRPAEGSTTTKNRPTEGSVANADDISSFYEPNTGHKYYVLERQDQPAAPPPPQQLPPPPSQQQLQQLQQQLLQQQLQQPEQ